MMLNKKIGIPKIFALLLARTRSKFYFSPSPFVWTYFIGCDISTHAQMTIEQWQSVVQVFMES
jgi:hypothetical protein